MIQNCESDLPVNGHLKISRIEKEFLDKLIEEDMTIKEARILLNRIIFLLDYTKLSINSLKVILEHTK